MSEMTPIVPPPVQDLIPETAPFTREQRLWLNGFFAGLLSVEAEAAAGARGGTRGGADRG